MAESGVTNRKFMTIALTIIGVLFFLAATYVIGRSRTETQQPQTLEKGSGIAGSPESQEFDAQGRATGNTGPENKQSVPAAPSSTTRAGTKIIKNGAIELRVAEKSFNRSLTTATQIAKTFGGFVANSAVTHQPKEPSSATITILVPTDKFDTVMNRLKDIGKVRNENISSRDVSKEFVDLEARLRNQQAQEKILLILMERADTVGDTIAVQQQLSQVQEQIEQLKGQLDFLKGQVDFSTIELSINTSGPVVIQTNSLTKAFNEAWQAFLVMVTGAIILLGYLAGLAIVLAIPAAVIWLLVRRQKNKAQDL